MHHLSQSTSAPESKMPSSLQKTRKHIAKKRNGEVNALHAKSRDSLRLHKAGVRDQRLEKLAAARSKKEQPIGMISAISWKFSDGDWSINLVNPVDRVTFFQESLAEKDNQPLDLETVQSYIKR